MASLPATMSFKVVSKRLRSAALRDLKQRCTNGARQVTSRDDPIGGINMHWLPWWLEEVRDYIATLFVAYGYLWIPMVYGCIYGNYVCHTNENFSSESSSRHLDAKFGKQGWTSRCNVGAHTRPSDMLLWPAKRQSCKIRAWNTWHAEGIQEKLRISYLSSII